MADHGLVRCPFDKGHLVLQRRLSVHINRCARNHPNANLSCCPFDSSHWVEPENMKAHLEDCKSVCELVDVLGELPPRKPHMGDIKPHMSELLSTEENWDDEPPAPTYNPQEECKKKNIVRNAQGYSKSERVAFRKKERERLRKLSENAAE